MMMKNKTIIKKENSKPAYLYFLVIVLSFLFLWGGNHYTSQRMLFEFKANAPQIQKAKIISIDDVVEEIYGTSGTHEFKSVYRIFTAEITSGELKGEQVQGVQSENSYFMHQLKAVEEGNRVILYQMPGVYEEINWVFSEYIRTHGLVFLGALFFIALIIFGGIKGVQTILSLTFTIAAIFGVFIPAILGGMSIYFWATLIALYIILMTLLLVGGLNRKTLAAILGCISGILVAAILMFMTDRFIRLTGFVNDDAVHLLMLKPDNPINIKAVYFSAMLIGALGAIMDVAMSIASSVHEIHQQAVQKNPLKLFQSGMTIGKDIMGTMANTLVLAYIGSSLGLVILLIYYNPILVDFLNREIVVMEIFQALIGSLGILFTIPMTAALSTFFCVGKKEQ